jgi:hypothetical protein
MSVACACLVVGQQSASADRRKASDYPVSASASRVELGAEFLIHAIPSSRGYYFAKSYLVVDVGVFPKPDGVVKVAAGQFTLRLNEATIPLLAQSPGMVAASLKYADWDGEQTGFSGRASVGDVGVTNVPPPSGRFPNDRRGPNPDNGAVNPNQEDAPDHQISLAALPDALSERPVRGCVFFSSDMKAKKIKSVELEWTGSDGDHAVLKLR